MRCLVNVIGFSASWRQCSKHTFTWDVTRCLEWLSNHWFEDWGGGRIRGEHLFWIFHFRPDFCNVTRCLRSWERWFWTHLISSKQTFILVVTRCPEWLSVSLRLDFYATRCLRRQSLIQPFVSGKILDLTPCHLSFLVWLLKCDLMLKIMKTLILD